MAEETTNKDNIDVNDPFSDKSMFAVDKGIDTTDIDKAISGLEKPASGSVYDKLAARYRSQGAGAVLRTQKNLANLFLPTVNLIQEREADALARYTLFKQGLEDFDDSTIFGQADGSEMPIVDEIKSLANMTKEDMRELSRLNPADERYDVLAKKIQKNNEAIANFDDINQKLLEIRNAQDGSDDASQWSKGMTQTERDMWMDIYTGKGNNIKIQDGKLVWTDTRGETKYNFEGGHYEDDKYEALKRSGPLGDLAFWSRDRHGEQKTFNNGEKGNDVDYMQMWLNDGGFTDADGNKLKEDGVWGPKSQAAYDEYLAKKDDLEQAYFDENLSEEDKKKYGVTTGVGETKVIDLNNISGGPTMIQNDATIVERKIQGGVQDLINSGVGIDDPNYQRTVKSMIFQLNQTGPAGIKSLIFDGLNTDDDDIFTSENTNSFIEGIIANNAEELGIKDPKNITEQELESAIEKLKEGDVTIQYDNGEGKKESLQKQFLNWYKGQIDAKVEAGVKSKFSTTTGELKNENVTNNKNKGGKINKGKDKDKDVVTSSFEDYTSSFGDGETYPSSITVTLPVFDENGEPTGKTRRIDADQIQVTFENGQPAVQYVPGEEKTKYQSSRSEIIEFYQSIYTDAKKEDIEKFVDEQIEASKEKATEKKQITKNKAKKLEPIDKLLSKSATIGGKKVSDYLLSYGDDDFVINSLNREYGKLGFTFEYEDLGAFDSDALKVTHKNRPNESYTIRFDTVSDDERNTKRLIGIMKAMYQNDYSAAQDAF